MGADRDNPLEQLVELLIYAPVGLLYEYDEVLPKLIRRGRSQVALARFLGQMAVRKGSGSAEDALGDLVTTGAGLLARAITEFGVAVGLAPDAASTSPAGPPASTGPSPATAPSPPEPAGRPPADEAVADEVPADEGGGSEGEGTAAVDDAAGVEAAPTGALPIVGYDQLPAREIVKLLDDLTVTQRERIRAHETANRARKTVLAKLDRLDRS